MISDASCMIGRTAEQMADQPPVPAVPPAEWFDPPTATELAALAADRPMIDVTVCGADIGKIIGVVAVEGIPFRTSYGDLVSPMLANVDVSEINDRRENMMRLERGGQIVEIPAGKFRFGHSPDYLDTLDLLHAFHDQNEGTLARFRLHPVELGGRRALIMKGAVLASVLEPGAALPRPVTYADLDQLHHAETSPEWYENERGEFVYIAHSFVGEGNTNMFTDEERAAFRAELRKAKIVAEEPHSETVAGCTACEARDAEAAAAEAEAAEQRIADMADRLARLEQDTAGIVEHLMTRAAAG